jgi:hypothetical protein
MQKAPPPTFREGVRQEPLTVGEVEERLKQSRVRLEACYRAEAMNSPKLSSYVMRMRVPSDGERPEVTVVKATLPEQKVLEDCVRQVLRALRFPAHSGGAIELEVPIER